jgi:hypothetical protein
MARNYRDTKEYVNILSLYINVIIFTTSVFQYYMHGVKTLEP